MANFQTSTRAAECGACGQPAGRHIWGPERASMAGDGCDGWEEEAEASSSSSTTDRCGEHERRNCPTCFPEPDITPEEWKAMDDRIQEAWRAQTADTIRRSGWYAHAWERKAAS